MCSMERDDPVEHPGHYAAGGVECITVLEQQCKLAPPDQAFAYGCVGKYWWRAYSKGKTLEDLKKCRWYLNRLIDGASKCEGVQ